MSENIKSRIADIMYQKRFNRTQLMEACGFSYDTAGRIKKGDLNFSFKKAIKVAQVLGVKLDDLIEEVEE